MNLETAELRRREILKAICSLGDMRRGTLTERHLPCGRAGCHCGKRGSPGHGPKYSLTYKVQGKTKTEYLGVEQVDRVGQQLENRKTFAALSTELLEVNEEICRLRFEQGAAEDSKKNSSRRSRRRSARKSSGS